MSLVLIILTGYVCMVFANDVETLTFKHKGYTYRVKQDDKVELIGIPQKFKNFRLSNCLVDLTSTISYKKRYYKLVSIADNAFSDIYEYNKIVLQIPPTVKSIGLNNQISDLYYNDYSYNNWLDINRIVLLSKNGESIVWINKNKSRKVKQIALPEGLKSLPVWFWGCFPSLQVMTLPGGLDKVDMDNLFDGCTPYMNGKTLFLVKSNKTGEIVWKSPLCSHVTVLDYPYVGDAEHQDVIKNNFPELEICSVEGCEYPCIFMDNIPYNPINGKPVIKVVGRELFYDTLSVSVSQFLLATPEFIASKKPKHINVVKNAKGDVRFNGDVLEYVSRLVDSLGVTISLTHINKCFIDTVSTPYENYYGNLYNPTTNDLFILSKQDTVEVWMNDENRVEMHKYVGQLGKAQAVKHIELAVENVDTLSDVEMQDMEKILATGISASPSKSLFKVVEHMPEFPGGMSALMRFLSENVRYPTICQELGIAGRVVVQCVIDENGNIVDPEIVGSVNPHLDREALRVVSIMPPWKPGMLEGKAVSVRFTIPIDFKLRE